MCGRFYIDDDTAREIERVIRIADEKVKKAANEATVKAAMVKAAKVKAVNGSVLFSDSNQLVSGDIHPTEEAPILIAGGSSVTCEWLKWGFPGSGIRMPQEKQKLIINARSETALERPMFCESILRRRAVIPAAGFYEWNSRKEKSRFYREDKSVLFMAGCYRRFEDGNRFVILTTQANDTMKPVHDRMPLLLELEEVCEWILEDGRAEGFLRSIPHELTRTAEYSQISLFD